MYNTIQIDGITYNLVPQYKVGDWVVYLKNNEIRRVITNDEAKERGKVVATFGSYMTIGATVEFQKDIRPATFDEIHKHLTNILVCNTDINDQDILVFNNHEFRYLHSRLLAYCPKTDTLRLPGPEHRNIIYQNGVWATKQIEEKQFFFGEHKVKFTVSNDFKNVTLTCNNYSDTLSELEAIVKNPTIDNRIGGYNVKGFTLRGELDAKKTMPAFPKTNDINFYKTYIDEVIIGCTVGKYSELVDIYNHAKSLIK